LLGSVEQPQLMSVDEKGDTPSVLRPRDLVAALTFRKERYANGALVGAGDP
jgi:hypothetical protein